MFFTFVLAWVFAAIIIYLWCYIVEVVLDLPVTGQTPCTAHASLKNIIRRVLRDASNLAILKAPQKDEDILVSTNKRTYEDLLATAILNKVIDNYQTDLRRSSSGSTSSKRSNTNSKKQSKNRQYDEEKWRTNVENPDFDTTSVSSVEEWCRSESSCGSKYVDHMNFTIKQSIEEISTSDEETPSNNYLSPNNLPQNKNTEKDKFYQEDWQDNWLFSRRDKSSPKPVPVPMLVPNPSTEYRALIGDRDAEDTTDLSETGSDLEETDSIHDIKTMLVDSRTVIGGKNLLGDISNSIYENVDVTGKNTADPIIEECLSKNSSFKNETAAEEANKDSGVDEDLVSEAKNCTLITEVPYVESDSFSSNTEKDMEYTERYASIPRQISKEKKSPIPSPRTSVNTVTDKQREELIKEHNKAEDDKEKEVEETEQVEEKEEEEEEKKEEEEERPITIRGSYSEKEKAKWRNPVVLSNNPYSKENLDKRLQNTSGNETGFGRDYYLREAKKAAGGREKFLQNLREGDFQNDVPDNPAALELEEIKPDPNIFTAVPAVVEEDYTWEDSQEEYTEEKEDDLEELHSTNIPPPRPISLALSTDSEDTDVKRVYNIETGKITKYRNSDFAKKIIEDSRSPVGSVGLIMPNELVDTSLEEKINNNFMEDIREPIMNISKLNHILNASSNSSNNPSSLESEDVIFKPSYTELQTSEDEIEIVTSPVINREKSAVFTPPEMRESSKKFLLNLVKNRTNSTSTPPISLQEFDYHTNEVDTPTGNLIDIYTNDITPDIVLNNKSCIDLRFICQMNDNKPSFDTQMSLDSSLLSTQSNGFVQSTPNLNDDYYEDNRFTSQKNKDLEELSELLKPSVKDLKKLFDEEENSDRVPISRTKSHLTTKPELKAHRQIHSLTARSLSKEFRRELSKSEDKNEIILENKSVEDDEEDSNELEIIPPCQSKIAFFETLKNN